MMKWMREQFIGWCLLGGFLPVWVLLRPRFQSSPIQIKAPSDLCDRTPAVTAWLAVSQLQTQTNFSGRPFLVFLGGGFRDDHMFGWRWSKRCEHLFSWSVRPALPRTPPPPPHSFSLWTCDSWGRGSKCQASLPSPTHCSAPAESLGVHHLCVWPAKCHVIIITISQSCIGLRVRVCSRWSGKLGWFTCMISLQVFGQISCPLLFNLPKLFRSSNTALGTASLTLTQHAADWK